MLATATGQRRSTSSSTARRGLDLAVLAGFTITGLAGMFSLYTPFDFAEAGTRVITSSRMALLGPAMAIGLSMALGRGKRILEAPGLTILVLNGISLVVTALAFSNDAGSALLEAIRSSIVLGYVANYMVFFSVKRIKAFVHLIVYAGAVLVVLSRLGILTPSVLPSTIATYVYMLGLRGQLASTGLNEPLRRGSILWLDANNSAYLLVALALLGTYIVIGERRSSVGFAFHLAILILFLTTLALTLSRGAVAALAVGLAVLLPLMGATKKGLIFLLLTVAGLGFLGFTVPAFSDSLDGVLARMDLAQNLFSGQGNYTGQESQRLETAQLAIEDFAQLSQPAFGRGPGMVGSILGESTTGNHVFYLNLLVQWGVLGAALYGLAVLHLTRKLWSTVSALPTSSAERGLAVVLLSIVAAGLVQGLFAYIGPVWLGLALGMALRQATVRSMEGASARSSPSPTNVTYDVGGRLVSRSRWANRGLGDRLR